MKSTGIVRRIDNLGRVVIPKEIRKELNLATGDPLEIFMEGSAICFQKYCNTDAEELEELRRQIVYHYEDAAEEISTLLEKAINKLKEVEG